ncbi:MAG: hypothetical protein Q7R30_07490 [Acidobacteriota bacterium]|nr:hypothetical protein [Acidobacteriota bacterium]
MTLLLGMVTDAAAQKIKTTCGADVALNVTVSGTWTAAGGYALVSDGLGVYQNAPRNKVTAIFQVGNCTHDFTLNLNQSSRTLWALLSGGDVKAPFFNFDRIHSVPITTDAPFLTSQFCTGGVMYGSDGKIAKNSEGAYQDNYAGCDVDEAGAAFVRRAAGVTLDGDERLAFQISPIDHPAEACAANPANPACGASFIRVYHPDATTWVLRPEPAATASHKVWAGGSYVFVGYETVPLEIVVTKQ